MPQRCLPRATLKKCYCIVCLWSERHAVQRINAHELLRGYNEWWSVLSWYSNIETVRFPPVESTTRVDHNIDGCCTDRQVDTTCVSLLLGGDRDQFRCLAWNRNVDFECLLSALIARNTEIGTLLCHAGECHGAGVRCSVWVCAHE